MNENKVTSPNIWGEDPDGIPGLFNGAATRKGQSFGTSVYNELKDPLNLVEYMEKFAPFLFQDKRLVDFFRQSPIAQVSLHSPHMAMFMQWFGYACAGEPEKALGAIDRDLAIAYRWNPAILGTGAVMQHFPHIRQVSQATEEARRKINSDFIDWFIKIIEAQNPSLAGYTDTIRDNLNYITGNIIPVDDLPRKYNFTLQTLGKDDSHPLQEVQIEHLTRLFSNPDKRKWPQLLLTANHALARNEMDVTSITNGFLHKAGRALGLNRPVEAIHDIVGFENAHKSEDLDLHGKAVVVAAIHAGPNSLVSGGKLLSRIIRLIGNYSAMEGMDVKQAGVLDFNALYKNMRKFGQQVLFGDTNAMNLLPRMMDALTKTHQPTDELDNPFECISPAAVMLEKTILRLLIKNPQRLEENYPKIIANLKKHEDGEQIGKAFELAYDEHTMPSHLIPAHMGGDEPGTFQLREDAAEVAQHIRLEGYSKGGNVVTDAMRLLAFELNLMAQNHCLRIYASPTSLTGATNGTREWRNAGKEDIAELLKNIGILTGNAGEIPLSRVERDQGLRRIGIGNVNDLISSHFRAGFTHEAHRGDEFIPLMGTKHNQGHHPKDAFGYFTADGKFVPGYFAASPEADSAVRVFFSSIAGLPSITDIFPTQHNGDIALQVRTAAGATEKQIASIEKTLNDAIAHTSYAGSIKVARAPHSTSLQIMDLHREAMPEVIGAIKASLVKLDAENKLALYLPVIKDLDKLITSPDQAQAPETRTLPAGRTTYDPTAHANRVLRRFQ